MANKSVDQHVITEAERYGINPDMLFAIRDQGERSGNTAVSPKGARGRWQFMPATAKQYGVDVNDENSGATGAARFMSDIIKKFRKSNPGLTDREYEAAAVAYYNGGGKAGNAVISGRQPPARETQNYLKRTGYSIGNQSSDGNTTQPQQEDDPELNRLFSDFGITPSKPVKTTQATNTQQPSNSTKISDDPEFDRMMADFAPAPVTSPTSTQPVAAPVVKSEPPFKRPGWFGESDVGDTGVNPQQGPSDTGTKVFRDSMTSAMTAGAVQNKSSTPEERLAHPIASGVGSIIGTMPYAIAAPVLGPVGGAALLGGRAVGQTLGEGGSKSAAAVTGALEGGFPLIGRGASKLVGSVVNKAGEKIAKSAGIPDIADKILVKNVYKTTREAMPKQPLGEAVNEATGGFANVGRAGAQAASGDIKGATATISKPIIRKLVETGAINFPGVTKGLIAALPESNITRNAFKRIYMATAKEEGSQTTKLSGMYKANDFSKKALDKLENDADAAYDAIQQGIKQIAKKGAYFSVPLPSSSILRESENRDRVNRANRPTKQ